MFVLLAVIIVFKNIPHSQYKHSIRIRRLAPATQKKAPAGALMGRSHEELI
jgi:hypothetical protein